MVKSFPKWPRTYHHPTSLSLQNDDRRLPTTERFYDAKGEPKISVYTEKYDGENFTLHREGCYPRSPDGRYHPSRDLMKAFHAERAHHIPEDWRISGESMVAVHAIEYSSANGNGPIHPFYGFGVWNEHNTLLPWDETLDVFAMLDIVPARTIHIGPYDEKKIAEIAAGIDQQRQEGFIVRIADAIPYPSGKGDAGRFMLESCKWVREKHVAGNQHWASGQWWPNELIQG